jgi:tetratricopeptide (TPR) repeat protein
VLANPLISGYLEWSLAPNYRTYCDMQAFIFNYFDLTSAYEAFRSDQGLGRILDRYRPRFVLAPFDKATADRMRLRPEYVPLTFDDTGILFGKAAEIPELAAHRLKSLDPFAAAESDAWVDQVKDVEGALREAKTVAGRSGAAFARDLAVRLELKLARNREAEADARSLASSRPDDARPEVLLGDAFMALARPAEAAAAYKRAVKRSGDVDRQKAQLKLGRAYMALGSWDKAYEALDEAVIVVNHEPSAKDLSDLLRAAAWSGHVYRASEILEYASLYLGEDFSAAKPKAVSVRVGRAR